MNEVCSILIKGSKKGVLLKSIGVISLVNEISITNKDEMKQDDLEHKIFERVIK